MKLRRNVRILRGVADEIGAKTQLFLLRLEENPKSAEDVDARIDTLEQELATPNLATDTIATVLG